MGQQREALGPVEPALAARQLGAHLRGRHQLGEAFGQQLPLQRLDEEVGRAGGECPFDRRLIIAAAEDEDRYRQLADERPDTPAQVEPVAVRQDRIEHHRIGPDRVERLQRTGHAGRAVHVDAMLGQPGRDQVLPSRIVLDEQDAESPDRRLEEGQERSDREVKGPILPQVASAPARPFTGISRGGDVGRAQT